MSMAYCKALVEARDPDRALATYGARAGQQARLWPIYAVNLEIARAPWASAEPGVAAIRLKWWEDALRQTAAGTPPKGHPVLEPLAEVVAAAELPLAPFLGLVAARQWDLDGAAFADDAALTAHLDATAGNVMWLAARSLGAPGRAEPVVRALAAGAGLANWLRAVPELSARGRDPLPDPAPEAVAALARRGLERVAWARAHRRQVGSGAVPALLAGWLAVPLLRLAVREPGRVATGGLVLSEFHRRGSLAWRGASGRW